MTTVTHINQLSLPETYKETLTHMLAKLRDYPIVRDIILFGSCARQDASIRSDIDLAIVVSKPISPKEEWDIDNNIRNWEADIACDIIFIPEAAFEREPIGNTVIRPILQEGVRLGGLLH